MTLEDSSGQYPEFLFRKFWVNPWSYLCNVCLLVHLSFYLHKR